MIKLQVHLIRCSRSYSSSLLFTIKYGEGFPPGQSLHIVHSTTHKSIRHKLTTILICKLTLISCLAAKGLSNDFDHKKDDAVLIAIGGNWSEGIYYQGLIREEGMQQSTSKNRMGGGTLLEKYSNI